jgi:hypothetical protein
MDDLALKVLERIGTGAVVDQFAIMQHFERVKRAFKIKMRQFACSTLSSRSLGRG